MSNKQQQNTTHKQLIIIITIKTPDPNQNKNCPKHKQKQNPIKPRSKTSFLKPK
jgi:hypothetical protein